MSSYPAREGRLRDRLATDAGGDLEVTYRTVDTPAGPLLVAATEIGIVRSVFAGEAVDAVLADLAERVSPRILRAGSRLDAAARQLDEYFDGDREDFDLALDDRLTGGFRLVALRAVEQIPYGETASYGDIAVDAGSPRAARAVGTACRTNPITVIRPCHRVIHSDGTLGGYGGRDELKAYLLELEGVSVARGRWRAPGRP